MMNEKDRITSLVIRLKNGDNAAFDELYKLTCSKVYFVSLKITKNEHDTEDIIQESYVTALKKLDTLEKPESFMSWFNQIVANKSKAYLRKTTPQFFEDAGYETVEAIPDDRASLSPEDAADKEDLRSKVMEAIDELTEEKRACVMMMYFGDMSVNDISQSLGVPVSTVKNRLWTARKDLKSRFEKRGIAAAYSVAPMGLVSWALKSSAEAFSQTFRSGINPSDIISVAAAGTATAGTAAAGSGIAAKIAALSTIQKIAAGVAVAGVVAGSTVGITTVVKSMGATDDVPLTDSATAIVEEYTDNYAEIPVEAPVIEIVEEAPPPVHIVEAGEDEEKPKHEAVFIQNIINMATVKAEYAGTVVEGVNKIKTDGSTKSVYCDIHTEKTGYYLLSISDNEKVKLEIKYNDNRYYERWHNNDFEKTRNIPWTAYIEYPEENDVNSISTVTSHLDYMTDYPKTLCYMEEGNNFIIIYSQEEFSEAELNVEFYGEEITDVEFLNNSLDNRIIGYNLNAPYVTTYNDSYHVNAFDINIKFSSGKELFMGSAELEYYVAGGVKEGENNAVFLFPGVSVEKTMTVHRVTDYVAEIEIEKLEDFLKFEINENGFDINNPEEYTVTVTYGDGTKETFNGADWDKNIVLEDGTVLVVEFTQPKLIERESVKFIVAIGDTEYIEEPCRLTGVDPVGFTKKVLVFSGDVIDTYKDIVTESYTNLFAATKSFEDFATYLPDALDITVLNMGKCSERLFGYGLDLFITLIKIASENIFVK